MEKRVGLFILTIFLISFISALSITGGAVSEQSLNSKSNMGSGKIEIRNGTYPDRPMEKFCGTSTLGACESDEDCIMGGCSNSVCLSKKENANTDGVVTSCVYLDCFNHENYLDQGLNCKCIDKKCGWSDITGIYLNNKKLERMNSSDNKSCPENCTCSGSTMKCELENGAREMTITAGNSGNEIIQVKGVNSSTTVNLYKSDEGRMYILNKGNKTKKINLLPNQVHERIAERLSRELENETIELDENGTYNYQAKNIVKLFALFTVKMKVKAKIDAESGNVTKIAKPWWSFLAVEKETIVGESCGTVTPGYNDKCCEDKGYNFWNNETATCEFLAEVNL